MPVVSKDTKRKNNENLIPQNIEAEEAILGAVLVNPETLSKVSDMLLPTSFYKPAHRYIFEAMLQLFNNNDNIDIVSVSDVLSYNGKLEAVGGRAYINDLAENTITTSNIAYYAKIIQEKAVKRALINAGSEIVSKGYDLEPSDESLEQAERLIYEIGSAKATSDLKPIKDLVLDTWDNIEYRYNHKDELSGVRTGFNELDTTLNGLNKSDLIILAARPAMGKTALALNIAQNIAIKEKVPVCIFSLEMSASQLVTRMLCSHAEVDAQRLKTGNMLQKDLDKLAMAMNDFGQSKIYIDDSGGCTLTDIRTKCRRLKSQQKDLGLIVIDYLQLIEGSGKDDRLQQISAISRGLKILAKELNVPVIALSQLSRAVEGRNDKRPMLSDLRESGSIEQDADIVMFIYRADYYAKEDSEEEENIKASSKGMSEIIIAKHRNGPVGTVNLLFQSNITKFKNPIPKNFDAF
ncbi:replicative DNA helicase [bacterium]|nr:replicative DNA helicase [bacterium]